MKKIVTVLGAGPKFIKASVVSHAIRQTGQLHEVLVHTGRHFDANMSDVFFEELGMHKPDHFLDIHGGGHGAMTDRMLEQVEKVLITEKPVAVLVYGETEWVELVDAGCNRLVPPLSADVVEAAIMGALGQRGAVVRPYGTGNAARLIVGRLVESLVS